MLHKTAIAAIALALAPPFGAAAQSITDVSDLRDIEELEVITADGEVLGEIETVLVDQTGMIVGVAVEVGGFLGVGDDDRVIPLERLVFDSGGYYVDITREEVERLPAWED